MAEVTSSSLVGPTILFKGLADFLRLMISHLDQFWTSEEKIMASFTKRNGKWRARIRRSGLPPITKSFPTKALALQWSQRVECEPEKFLDPPPLNWSTAYELQRYTHIRAEDLALKLG